MAEDDQKDRNLPPKDFVDALIEDPANPPQLQVLNGYRGRSAQEGHTRFYVDVTLSAWVDVPDDAILFQREVKDEIGLSKSLVWTRLDAQIQIGPQAGGGTGADFLQGQVAQDLGGSIGGIGGIGTPLRTPVFVCPTQPPFCIKPTQNILCVPSVVRPCITQQIFCPTQDPNLCVLQTANPLQCPSLGITCTALPPCPPRTLTPEQCPTLGFTCTALPPCPPRTLTPEQCPSLGITCTFVAPCTVVPPQPTQNIADCIPQPSSDPRLCPVATPNPGCIPIPGGPGGPGGPVEGGGVQGFGGIGAVNFNVPVQTPVAFCPPLQIQTPQLQLTPGLGNVGQRAGIPGEPIGTMQGPCPDTSWPQCPPRFGGRIFDGGQFGFQGAQAMGAAAVAGPGPAVPQTLSCPSQFAACTQFCPAPNTTQLTCPVTRNIQCFTSRMCPRSTFCPSVAVPCQTGQVCQPVTLGCPFGGGGGFGGGF